MSSGNVENLQNYLVPASGQVHGVQYNPVLTATPFVIDWRQFSVDNFPFQPQGVFIDNSQGTGELVITIAPLNWTVRCPAGVHKQAQFPAPNGQTASITGAGQATLIFVDFPVLPDAGEVNIGNTVQVSVVSPDPLPTQPTNLAAGSIPYGVQQVPLAAKAYQATIAPGSTSATITPTANLNLRKLILTLSAEAAQTTAGTDLLTVALNGVTLYKQNVYVPAVGVNNGPETLAVLDFDALGFNAGAGSLVVSLATALTAGDLDINAYFA